VWNSGNSLRIVCFAAISEPECRKDRLPATYPLAESVSLPPADLEADVSGVLGHKKLVR